MSQSAGSIAEFFTAAVGLQFSHPREWTVLRPPTASDEADKLLLSSSRKPEAGTPTVIFELHEASLAYDIEHVLDAVTLRLNAEMQDLEIVNKTTQQVRGQLRGVLVSVCISK